MLFVTFILLMPEPSKGQELCFRRQSVMLTCHSNADTESGLHVLQTVYKLDGERLYATYFGGEEKQGLKPDEEARQIWSVLLHHSFSFIVQSSIGSL